MRKILAFILFDLPVYLSIVLAVGIDAYYNFDIKTSDSGFMVLLFSYLFFCFWLAYLLSLRIIKISVRYVQLILFIIIWSIPTVILYFPQFSETGFIGSINMVFCFTSIFCGVILLIRYFGNLWTSIFYKTTSAGIKVAKYKTNFLTRFFVFWLIISIVGVIMAPILRPNIDINDPRMNSYNLLLLQLTIALLALFYMLKHDLSRK